MENAMQKNLKTFAGPLLLSQSKGQITNYPQFVASSPLDSAPCFFLAGNFSLPVNFLSDFKCFDWLGCKSWILQQKRDLFYQTLHWYCHISVCISKVRDRNCSPPLPPKEMFVAVVFVCHLCCFSCGCVNAYSLHEMWKRYLRLKI